MVVSKNALPLIGGSPVEPETSGEWSPEFAQSLDRFFPATITGNLELPRTGYPHFDLVAFFQLQSIDYGRGQPDGETVSPFRYLHGAPWIYIAIVYPRCAQFWWRLTLAMPATTIAEVLKPC
jgi:hypothetical protein